MLLGVLTSALIAACGSDDAGGDSLDLTGDTPTATQTQSDGAFSGVWSDRAISEANAELPFVPILINSQRLALGENRLQFAFEWRDGRGFVEHADDTSAGEVRVYYLGDGSSDPELVDTQPLIERTLDYATPAGPPATPEGTTEPSTSRITAGGESTHTIAMDPWFGSEPRFTNHDGEHATVFTARVGLDRTEIWGVEVDLEVDGELYENVRVIAFVQERLPEPMVGEAIPASTQPTAADVENIADIDSSSPPVPELHEVTVAEALEAGEPMVIAFTTPAFCQTRFCGPIQEQVVVPAWEQYGDRVRFIHIEPYDVPMARQGQLRASETTLEWGLTMEPIIFIVDADGNVAAKIDGIAEYEELAAALDAMLAGS